MKEKDLKEIVKEAVLEALNEFANGGVSTMSDPEVPEPDTEGDGNSTPEDPDSGNNGNNNNNGNGNGSTRPGPIVGAGGFSLR